MNRHMNVDGGKKKTMSVTRYTSVDRRTQMGNMSATINTCRKENKEDKLSVTRLLNVDGGTKLRV